MKLLITADIHCKISNRSTYLKFFEELLSIADKEKPNYIVILGDLFNNKALIRSECLRDIIEIMLKQNYKWIILTGNHDYESLTCDNHSLSSLRLLNNVIVVERLYRKDNMIFLPYYHNKDEFLKQLDGMGGKYLFAHQSVNGMKYSNNMVENNGIDVQNFKWFPKVFLGHIHKPQEQDNIIYVGSPFTQSFDESEEEKSVIAFDSETGISKRIMLSQLPKHILFKTEIKSKEDIKIINLQFHDKDIIKLILSGPKSILNKISKKDFINPRMILQKNYVSEQVKQKNVDSFDTNTIFNTYLESYNTTCDKSKLLDLHNQILDKIKNE